MSADDDGSGKIHYLAPPESAVRSISKCQPIDPIKLQFKPVPQRDWLVPGYIPLRKVTLFYGPSGEGKTTIVQQLMTAAAIGQRWLGLEVKQVKSLGVFCEDEADDLHIRQHAINLHYGCEMEDLEDTRWLAQLGEPGNAMMTFAGGIATRTDFFTRVMEAAKTFGAQLVTLDTAADLFDGNQNDAGQARRFIQALAGMARDLDGAVVLCAHPSRSGQQSGSGDGGSVQWDAASRSRLYLTRPEASADDEPDPDARILVRKKANFAPRDEEMRLRWRDHVFVRDDVEIASGGIIGTINRRACETKFLDLMDEASRQGRQLSVTPTAGTYAPRVFMKKPKDARGGFGLRDLERAMEALLDGRELKIENSGPPSKPRSQLVRASDEKDGQK